MKTKVIVHVKQNNISVNIVKYIEESLGRVICLLANLMCLITAGYI